MIGTGHYDEKRKDSEFKMENFQRLLEQRREKAEENRMRMEQQKEAQKKRQDEFDISSFDKRYNRTFKSNDITAGSKISLDDYASDIMKQTKFISNWRKTYNLHSDFSLISIPKLDVDKFNSGDFEYKDKYLTVMKRRIERSDFLREKAERSNEFSQLLDEMKGFIDIPKDGRKSVTVDPYKIVNFILKNGIVSTLTMPVKAFRENWDDFISTPSYLMLDVADRIETFKLGRQAQKRYEDILENGRDNKTQYQKVEDFLAGQKKVAEFNTKLVGRALDLTNTISYSGRADSEKLIEELIKEYDIFSFDERAFDLYEKYRGNNWNYGFIDDPAKIRKLGEVSDMYDTYKDMDEFSTVTLNGNEYSKADYLEVIKNRISQAFDYSIIKDMSVSEYTQQENYGGFDDRTKKYDSEAEKKLTEIAIKQLIQNEVSKRLRKRGYGVKDTDIKVDIENSEDGTPEIKVSDYSIPEFINTFNVPIENLFKHIENGRTDLKAVERDLRNGNVEGLDKVLDKKYPDTGYNLDKNKIINIDFSDLDEMPLDIEPDDYKFIDSTKLRIQDLPQFKKISEFYEKAIVGISREQIEEALIKKSSIDIERDTDYSTKDDISLMRPEVAKILQKSVTTTFFNDTNGNGVELNASEMNEIERLVHEIGDIAAQRRSLIKESDEYIVREGEKEFIPENSMDGVLERREDMTDEEWQRQLDMYDGAERSRIIEELEDERRMEQEHFDDVNI